jgi:hypothetical protein
MLWAAVLLTALAVLWFETMLALRASGNLEHAKPYASLISVVLATGIVLLVFA